MMWMRISGISRTAILGRGLRRVGLLAFTLDSVEVSIERTHHGQGQYVMIELSILAHQILLERLVGHVFSNDAGNRFHPPVCLLLFRLLCYLRHSNTFDD